MLGSASAFFSSIRKDDFVRGATEDWPAELAKSTVVSEAVALTSVAIHCASTEHWSWTMLEFVVMALAAGPARLVVNGTWNAATQAYGRMSEPKYTNIDGDSDHGVVVEVEGDDTQETPQQGYQQAPGRR